MYLEIENCPKNKLSLKRLRAATDFFCSKLMTPKLIDEIAIVVRFKPLIKDYKNLAWFWQLDNENPNCRAFIVEIDPSISMRRILLSLAHELVHIKQFCLKELIPISEGTSKWANKVYEDTDSDEVYWDTPWEIEAHGREYGLYTRFKKFWSKRHDSL